jgi:hypothetical protein
LIILDTSQIQQHKPKPQVQEVSRLTWNVVSIPQNAIPFTSHGHRYLLEFDEYATGHYGSQYGVPGAARIIDLADDRHPRVVSDIRLQVHQPAQHAAALGDPGGISPVQGYAAHYCNIPTRVDPAIMACSMIASGLRVFDIRDVLHPKEIAYYVAPPTARLENGLMASDFAMSRPEFAPERREVWYADGTSGFYVLRLDKSVWPAAASPHLQVSEVVDHGGRSSRVLVHVAFDHEGEGPMPVSGATVTLGGRRVVTDANGNASVVVRPHRKLRLRLGVSKAGFSPQSRLVTLRR